MFRLFPIVFFGLSALVAVASAQVLPDILNGSGNAPASYGGPGDTVAFTAWYGLRAYNNTLANSGASTTPVLDVYGPTTATSCTIYLLGNGTGKLDLNTAGSGGIGNPCSGGATTFCSVTNTTCTVSKLYDQTVGNACGGSACDVVQATAAYRPTLLLTGCGASGTLPCLQGTSNAIDLAGANNITPASGVVSLITVAARQASSGTVSYWMVENGLGNNELITKNAANTWEVTCCSAGSIQPTATDDVWHAMIGVINGSSSVANLDGTEATGTIAGSTTAGKPYFLSVASSNTYQESEAGFIDNVPVAQGVRSALCQNAASYYGTAAGTYC
jgi:hypothetical protein